MQKYRIIGRGAIGRFINSRTNIEIFNRFSLENYQNGIDFGKEYTYFFTAGMSKPNQCEQEPELLEKIVQGTIDAIKDISKENRVIFFSSDVVLGKDTAYSKSKKQIEKNIQKLPNVIIVRLSYVFYDVEGYLDPFTSYALNEKDDIEVYRDLKRNIIHIHDVLDGLIFIADKWAYAPPIVNLAGKNCIDKSLILKYINKKFTIIEDREKIDNFFKTRDTIIEAKPNFYVPKINFKGQE